MNTPQTSTKLRVVIAGVAAGALVLTGCSSDSGDTNEAAQSSEIVESTPIEEPTNTPEGETKVLADPAIVANPLPVFSSTTLDGQSVTHVVLGTVVFSVPRGSAHIGESRRST